MSYTVKNFKGKNLVDLFFETDSDNNPISFDECFLLLRRVNPRVIDEIKNDNQYKYRFVYPSKLAVVAWIDYMRDCDYLHKDCSYQHLADKLNDKIKGLNITEKTLRDSERRQKKEHKKFYQLYSDLKQK